MSRPRRRELTEPSPMDGSTPVPTAGLPRVGAHLSIAGGHGSALRLGRQLGCEVVQVFTKNNLQWAARPLSDAEIAAYQETRDTLGYASADVFAHAGYLINLASDDPALREKSRVSLLDELERCRQLGLPFLVLHPGSHRGLGREPGIARVCESLDWVFARFEGAVRLALEFTAGAGHCLGGTIADLADIIGGSPHADRLAVCLDTCHLFAAGIDLRQPVGIARFIDDYRRRLPWETVVCVHVNDSKGALGSRLDRHELLGRGQIGWECFDTLLRHPGFRHLPFCLETPKGDDHENDRATLSELKRRRL